MGIGGTLTIGEALMFIYLIKRIIMPIEVIFCWMASIPVSAASWERVQKILDVSEESRHTERLLKDVENLNFCGVCFSYDDKKIFYLMSI